MADGTVNIEYNVKENKFNITSNMTPSGISEVIESFLRSQQGQGRDNSKANELDIYNIKIDVDLSQDILTCSHNCGNKGLREGILMHFLSQEKN